jgi:aspartyl-tRNA(Asn)/glutamyl-tRNA(Gln) amidotransferase subunit B
MVYQPIIGLEIHIELKTKSKMFCSCKNDPDEREPNKNICPICTAQPGTLPVINQEAVKKVIKTGLALNCQIPESSQFDRKNYFYPDLPKGYQISQLYMPLCKNGFLEIDGKKIRIREVHLEEDTGRLIHPENEDISLVDFNRAGIPLMELVTEPDLKSAQETKKFAEELHLMMHYLDISDADMEKGQMRVEVNISLSSKSRVPAKWVQNPKLGTKVEIKNLNSFRAVEKAIDYEIERQTAILNKKGKIAQETRGWDDAKAKTVGQREKEAAHDYRYFPEPDLPPLRHSREFIEEIKAEIPELPWQREKRLRREYELDEKNIEIFVYRKDLGEYFEKVVSEFPSRLSKDKLSRLVKLCTNWLITDLQGLLKGRKVSDRTFKITPENFAEFIVLISEDKISSKIAKLVLAEMFVSGGDPSEIIKEKGLVQITDSEEIEKVIKEVISQNPKPVKDFKGGKENALQFLVGQIMAKTGGKASPEMVNKTLKRLLTKIK